MEDLWMVFCGESGNLDIGEKLSSSILVFQPTSCINHALIICFSVLLLAMLLLTCIQKSSSPSKKDSIQPRFRGYSRLRIVSAIFNGCIGFVYLCLGIWILEEQVRKNQTALPLKSWLVVLFQGFTWLLVGLTISLRGKHLQRTPLRLLSILAFLFAGIGCAFSIYSVILGKAILVKIVLDVLSFPGSILLLVCVYKVYKHEGSFESDLYAPLNGEANGASRTDSVVRVTPFAEAGFFNKMSFWWLNPMMKMGKEKTLEDEDIPKLRVEDRAESCYFEFLEQLNKHKQAESSQPSLLWINILCHWKEILISGLFALLKILTLSAGPLLLNAFILVAEGKAGFKYEGYVLALTLFFSKNLESLAQRQWYFRSRLIGLKVKSLLTAAIYKKQLRLSNLGRLTHSSGEVMNYVTVDAYRIGEFPFWFHQTWTTGLQLCISLVILYRAMGLATFAALVVIIITVLCNAPLAKLQHKFQSKLMVAQDERLKACNEALVNMKVLKLYAWETHFKNAIENLRAVEYKWLSAVQLRRAYNSFLFWSSPVLVSAVTFGACYFMKIPLRANNVFTFVATLRLVQDPIRSIPDVIGVVIQAKVAFARIVKFLEAPELQSRNVQRRCNTGSVNHSVLIKSADFSWEENSSKPTLRNVSLKIMPGEKVAVCGEVGSGKSTLLAAILGEVPHTKGTIQVYGRIAYVSQTAWIQTGTIQESILFGSEMDRQRYQDTLERCSLVKDLELLPYGDLTEIGERGVNLSGGQKQRIQLARALYQNADIYLLDDPFSAVDAETATSLFNEYITGALSGKTVLLVTHQVDFLPAFDSVMLMSDGEILQAAPYHKLLSSSQEFLDLVNAHKETAGSERLPEANALQRQGSSAREIKSYEEKQLKTSQGDQLIKQEEKEIGDAGLKPYIEYLNQNKGYLYFCLAAFGHLLFVTGQISQNSWMAANVDDPHVSTLRLIVVYLSIGVISMLFLLCRSIFTVVLGLQSSKSLFSQFLLSLFRAPMSFYDSTPLGRILSRVASDLSIVDLDVPFSLIFAVGATTNSYSNLGVLAVVTWQVLFVSIPMVYLAIRLQRYYFATAKELMRINGTTKSLVANHLAESVAGALTIRVGEGERDEMGIDAMRIRVQIRRFLVISFELCYRSVCKHPFLVGMVCYLLLLYRSFPFLFSLLVTASPVLICTAILLGTLLSFGEPNIPEVEEEEEEEEEEEQVSHEISYLKKEGVAEDATFVVQKDESFSLEGFVGNRDVEEESLLENKNRKIEVHGDSGDYMPLIDETSREVQFEKQIVEEVESDFDNLELGKKREIQEENLGIKEVLSHAEGVEEQYSLLQNSRDENIDDDNSVGEFIETHNGYLEFSQESSWKRAYHDDEEDDDEASDSGSDGVESSSPDASMADILPMLDELHPLLDEEAPQPANISNDGSDAGSEGSHKSDESSIESEEDVGNQADEDEDGDDDNDNEEEAQGSKEDESKSAIKWTEDDQKNLMDLGTLELERNQRLESLIARRRARRNMRLMAEKNLIDLDAADIPINIPSISTARHNPFDFPYDDVPGSAPSVLLPRRNPFDLPYDSNEEKPDLKGDSFQQEFSATQHREPFFRRHESFSIGPSTLAGTRQDLRWKPYFVPERFATEGTSYHTFQRQLSEASESKVSSVPDTESVSSALEEEDKRINEEDVSQETEMISNVDHASLLVERGSLSSEDVDSVEDEQVEKSDLLHDGTEIALGDVENHHEIDSGLSESGGVTPEELNTSEILLRMGHGEEDYSSRSSLSSLSEIDEKICDVNRGSTSLEPTNSQIEGSHISIQTSLDSDFHFVNGLADDNEHREPVLEPRNDHIDGCDISTQSSLDSDFHFTSQMMDGSQYREPGLESTGNQIGDAGILKESSTDSDSNVLSGLADDNQEPVLEPGGHHIEEPRISLQTSHNSDIHLTSEVVDDGQHSDPVYDSSPPSIETILSFSSLSSDTQRSEMGSPLAMAEFADKDSEAHAENLEKDTSSYQVMLESSSQAHSPDETEFRSTGVAENTGNEITELGFSGAESNFDGQNGFTKPESAAENFSVDSSPSLSDNGSAQEVVAGKEENYHHKEDRLHSSSLDAEIIVDGYKQLGSASSSYKMASEESNLPVLEKDYPLLVVEQVSVDTNLSASGAKPAEDHAIGIEKSFGLEQDQVSSTSFDVDIHADGFQAVGEKLDPVDSNSQHVPSNDLHLSVHEEREPSVVAEQVMGTHLDVSSSEMKLVEEHSSEKGETIQSEQDQVHLSSSDSAIGAGFHQDVDVTVVSSESGHQNPLSEEKPHLELEKQQSLSDKSMLEQSFSNHNEPRGLSVTISNNENIPEVHNPEETISRSITSLMPNFTSDSPNSLPYKSPAGGIDLKDDFLDKIVYEDYHQVLEHSNYPGEAYGPPVSEENINEDEDELKEIDEGLLSELDTVGDFSVKEVVGESLHDEQVPENTSVSPEFDFLPKDLSLAEVKPELPVLEVRSVEDIDLAFKQLHEGANVEEVILPSMVEEQLAEDESKHQTDSDLRVVEARSLEDIHIAMKQISEENIEELVDSRDATTEANEMGSANEIPVLEVKTIEDVDLAFRQLHEGVEVEEVIVPSAIEQQLVVDDTKDLGQTSSALPVVEARSLEDIHIAMKQVSEGNIEQWPKLLDLNDKPGHEAACTKEMDSRNSEINEEDSTEDIESSTVEVNEVSSIKAVESSIVHVIEVTSIKESEPDTAESGGGETSTIAPHESKHGFDETPGNLSSSISDTKGKKAKSHSSSSNSSSSSSSSSSDSD